MKKIILILILTMLAGSKLGAAEMISTGGSDPALEPTISIVDIIMPGDKLNIRVYREEELSHVWHESSVGYVVDAAGNLNFPLVGTMHASGQTLEAFQARLTEALSGYIVKPQVEVSFYEKADYQMVSALGQVNRPGNYKVTPGLSLVRLLSNAGGFTRLAALDQVVLTRGIVRKKSVVRVNVQAVLAGRAEDVRLEPGDVVYVPESIF